MYVVYDQDGEELYSTGLEWLAEELCVPHPEAPELRRYYKWVGKE